MTIIPIGIIIPVGMMQDRIYPDLATYLEDTGTTQAAFAERVGVSQAVISRIVNRQRIPDVDVALRISKEARIPLESMAVAS